MQEILTQRFRIAPLVAGEAHFRESLWFKGEWVDDIVFGMLASEWNNLMHVSGAKNE